VKSPAENKKTYNKDIEFPVRQSNLNPEEGETEQITQI
jgi:hypothetical protein